MSRFFGVSTFIFFILAASAGAVEFPGRPPGKAKGEIKGPLVLNNDVISAKWATSPSLYGIRLIRVESRADAGKQTQMEAIEDVLPGDAVIYADLFEISFPDGSSLTASQMKIVSGPTLTDLAAEPQSANLARRQPGAQLSAKFVSESKGITVLWRAILRDGANALRQEVELQADSKPIPLSKVTLLHLPKQKQGETLGKLPGSPVILPGNFFAAVEHPLSSNMITTAGLVCELGRNQILQPGKPLIQSSVIGVFPEGQRRRGFLYYLERERAHPYRPFLHYNNWFDFRLKHNAEDVKNFAAAIDGFGRELTEKRGVALDTFALDDGWDDLATTWDFDKRSFPDGLAPVRPVAEKYRGHLGLWLSPWGGYGARAKTRTETDIKAGYGTMKYRNNLTGPAMADPRYAARVEEVLMASIQKYGVNYFKIDGINAISPPESDAMFAVIAGLRRAAPELYVNVTNGSWASPFWLMHSDAVWRGESDVKEMGKGAGRERWLNYRDAIEYKNMVAAEPLYPLNAVMVHGIVFGNSGVKYPIEGEDFVHEIRSYLGSGTGLQELYITPAKMNARAWDLLAEALKWSRANSDVLADTHWVGGDPAKNEVYGWAAWSPRKGTLTLRNPDDAPRKIAIDIGKAFELPAGAAAKFKLKSPWADEAGRPVIELSAGKAHEFELKPFEVLVFDAEH